MPVGINKVSRNSQIGGDIPDTLVDNFEELLYEDQGRSLSDVYGGALSPYSRQTSTALFDSYSLEISGQSDVSRISDTDDLNHPTTSDVFDAWVRADQDSWYAGPMWFTQSESTPLSGYQVDLEFANNGLRLKRIDSGSFTELDSTSASLSSGSDFRVRVDPSDPITVTVYDAGGNQLAQVSKSDTTYTSGGVGWTASGDGNATFWVDEYTIA